MKNDNPNNERISKQIHSKWPHLPLFDPSNWPQIHAHFKGSARHGQAKDPWGLMLHIGHLGLSSELWQIHQGTSRCPWGMRIVFTTQMQVRVAAVVRSEYLASPTRKVGLWIIDGNQAYEQIDANIHNLQQKLVLLLNRPGGSGLPAKNLSDDLPSSGQNSMFLILSRRGSVHVVIVSCKWPLLSSLCLKLWRRRMPLAKCGQPKLFAKNVVSKGSPQKGNSIPNDRWWWNSPALRPLHHETQEPR